MLTIKIIYKKLIPEKKRIQFNVLLKKINSYKYLGKGVTCNCCNKKFKYFLPHGDSKIKRLNAECPWCQSLERTRILFDFLNKSTFLKNKNKILHFAPAKSLESFFLKNKNILYTSADLNPALAMKVVDITKIKYKENTFDLIICGHVLSVVKDDILALKEMYRVLKKGGTLLLLEHIYEGIESTFEDFSVKNDSERIKLYGQPYLERLYGNDFLTKPEEVGFKIEVYDHIKTMATKDVKRFGMGKGDLIYICKK